MRTFFLHWQIDSTGAMIFAFCVGCYCWLSAFRSNPNLKFFLAGLVVLAIAFFSPLHYAAMNYFFSAHMIVHVLLILVAAPLLVAGIPAENPISRSLRKLSGALVKYPVAAWLSGVGIMWFWHIPALFHRVFSMHQMAGENMPGRMGIIGLVEVVSLLAAGAFFAWPVVNPYPEKRLHPVTASLYLSAACIFCSLLGLLITFAPVGLYTGYLAQSAGHMWAQQYYGINEKTDQQAAGLIMWVPCCFIYLTAVMLLLYNWLSTGKRKPEQLVTNTFL